MKIIVIPKNTNDEKKLSRILKGCLLHGTHKNDKVKAIVY